MNLKGNLFTSTNRFFIKIKFMELTASVTFKS